LRYPPKILRNQLDFASLTQKRGIGRLIYELTPEA
jgi:hypothetical protein